MKVKRKARNTMSKKGLDLLKPVTIEMLGTKDDPCFGKHQDPRTPECSRCGDSELCAIAMQQNNQVKRAKVEADGNFMDIEEKDMEMADPKLVKKKIRLRIRELIKIHPQELNSVVDDVHNIYVMHGWDKPRIKKYIQYLVDNKDWISQKGNLLKFHKK